MTTLVARSPDLSALVADGFDLEIRDGNLLVHHVPYVNSAGEVDHCILVSDLSTNGERTVAPGRHEVWLVGDVPHDHRGQKISIIADENRVNYGDGLQASCRLSGKLHGQMPKDYHEKFTTYVDILGRYARAIDPSATHTHSASRETSPSESVFRYTDAATSRSGLSAVASKLKLGSVAIVGLGGTGGYILDLVAKTPVRQVHLFDDDAFYAHNAFRAPGAASVAEVKVSPLKVEYFAEKYAPIRRNLFPHPYRMEADRLSELDSMDFVFLAMDASPVKREIVDHLVSLAIPFVDCGMGVQRRGDSLRGTVRVTGFEPGRDNHLSRRISFVSIADNEYDMNIQTADLNMLNAALAVLKWKKLAGFYDDARRELNTSYATARNHLESGEVPDDETDDD